jgi:hypothetical protein
MQVYLVLGLCQIKITSTGQVVKRYREVEIKQGVALVNFSGNDEEDSEHDDSKRGLKDGSEDDERNDDDDKDSVSDPPGILPV